MKIKNLKIENFKSLKEFEINTENLDLIAFVGRNNSGKSNVVEALNLFFESSKKLLDDECFFHKETENPIKIFLVFERLTDLEKEKFKPWMCDDELIIGKEFICKGLDDYEIKNWAVTKVPEPGWLQIDMINSENIERWWADKDNLKIGDLDFSAEFSGNKKPGVNVWKETAEAFINNNKGNIPHVVKHLENPQGYSNVLKGALPEFIHIPAVRDISDEAKAVQASPFGKLINSVIEKISDEQKKVISDQLKEIQKQLNREGGDNRLDEIKKVERRLNKIMGDLMDCDIEIEMPMPELKEIFGAVKIYANDGERTTIEAKGHGLQRSMIFTILRAYAEFSHIKKVGDKAEERTTLFAVEEPEIYLHPQLQRTFMSVFRKIASGTDQIIYTTHSNLFVDITYFDEICIIRREKDEDVYISYPAQLTMGKMIEDIKVRKRIEVSEESMRELYSNVFNQIINEGFFGDKVIIVEGPSEQYSLPIYANMMSYDLDRNNVSIIHGDGKGQMDRLLRIFNGFKIPTFLLFDGDKDSENSNSKRETLELLNLLDSPISDIKNLQTTIESNYAVLENKLEDTLRKEIDDYDNLIKEAGEKMGSVGKPLKQKYIANCLSKRVKSGKRSEEVVPVTIRDIIEKIKVLSYKGSIFKKESEG